MAETTLFQVGLLFAAAALGGVLANRIGQSVIPLYILTGMVLGQSVLGTVPDVLAGGVTVAGYRVMPAIDVPPVAGYDVVDALAALAIDGSAEFVVIGAELGIVLLLFFLGLEFNIDRLIASRDRIGRAGTYDLVCNFGIGLVLGWILFGAFLPAFLTAGIVYISSSAIITKSLLDLGWIANDEANPMLGTLVFEDLFIAVYLAVAGALVLGGGSLGEATGQVAVAIGFILALLFLVYFGSELFQRALETSSHEYTVLRALGITVLIAGAALSLDVSEAVAAFFVGMAFSSTQHVQDLEELLEPLRDAFAAVFFFWIGLETDPTVFADAFVLLAIAAAVLVTTPTKLFSGYLAGLVYDLDERRSLRVGLGMTIRGEFSLIIAGSIVLAGAGTGLPTGTAETIYAFTVGYVLLMSILGTTLIQHADRIEALLVPRLEARRSPDSVSSDD